MGVRLGLSTSRPAHGAPCRLRRLRPLQPVPDRAPGFLGRFSAHPVSPQPVRSDGRRASRAKRIGRSSSPARVPLRQRSTTRREFSPTCGTTASRPSTEIPPPAEPTGGLQPKNLCFRTGPASARQKLKIEAMGRGTASPLPLRVGRESSAGRAGGRPTDHCRSSTATRRSGRG